MRVCHRCDREMLADGVTNTEGCKHYCSECVKEMFVCDWRESLRLKKLTLEKLAEMNDKYGDYSKMVK